MVWIKAHAGHAGNEEADDLAKEGGTKDNMQNLGLPVAELKRVLDESMRAKWDKDWQRYPHARQTKYFWPTQHKGRAKKVMELTRHQLGRYVRITTGHNNLAYHKSNMNPDIDPMCRFCAEVQESFIHLFSDCPAFWRERQEALGGFYPRAQQPNLDPADMIDFSYIPRINQALETEAETQQLWEDMEVLPSDEEDGEDERQEQEEEMEQEEQADEPNEEETGA